MRVAGVIVGVLAGTAVAHAQTPSILDQIEKAWKARGEKVRTADFRVHQASTQFKGGLTALGYPSAQEKTTPPTDVRSEWDGRFLLEGTKLRVDEGQAMWNGTEMASVRRTVLMDRDGRKSLEVGARPAPQGGISRDGSYTEATATNWRPLTRLVRGLDPGMRTFRIDDLVVTGVKSVVNGRACEQLVQKLSAGDRMEYWLDPARDWVLVRESYVHSGVQQTQHDIEYERHPEGGWVPTGWDHRSTAGGNHPVSVSKTRVTAVAINQPIAPGEFTLTFPAGTQVLDSSEPKKQVQGYTVATETVVEVGRPPDRPWWVWGLVGGAAVVIVGTVVARRRFRRDRSGAPD